MDVQDGSAVWYAHQAVQWCALHLKWALVPVAALCSIAATVLGFVVSAIWPTNGEWDWGTFWLVLAIVVLTIISVVCTTLVDISRRGQERGRISAKVSSQHELREAVLPTLRSIGKLSSVPQSMRTVQFAKTISQVLMARPTLFPKKEGVRMVIYGAVSDGSRHILTPIDHTGRAKDIPTDFDSSDSARGKKVFQWLHGNRPQTRYVADTESAPDQDWEGTGHGYRTYISTPIIANQKVFGMLTVDAPNPADLDETNIPMMEVLAHALGTAFVLRQD